MSMIEIVVVPEFDPRSREHPVLSSTFFRLPAILLGSFQNGNHQWQAALSHPEIRLFPPHPLQS
jgi:hypothetical protein